jgi:hypothetical protein
MQALNGVFSVFFADFGLPGQPCEMAFALNEDRDNTGKDIEIWTRMVFMLARRLLG